MLGFTPLDWADSAIVKDLNRTHKDRFVFVYNDAQEVRTYDEMTVEYAEYCATTEEYMPFDDFINFVVFDFDSDCTVYVFD